ncbi:hypothetical protein CK203_030460 [Vitis vinifera]|uniref:Retrovirus-related Pol polyprotein from transposon RE2 n=1 Tax=Vitis vinifera TaxID=29760 RepID=A0A438JDM8_VITVI|nr:hypothetical protein CK203_030460 [Vitis vinifera]
MSNSKIQYQKMRLLQHILLPKGVLFIQEELKVESPALHLIIRIPTITLKDGANHVVVIKVIIHSILVIDHNINFVANMVILWSPVIIAVDLILPLIYVDDILITSSTTQVFQFIKHLNSNFALRDLVPDTSLYCNTVRAFQYLMITHPDLSFAVNKACQFMAQPTTTHWLVIKRILRHLKAQGDTVSFATSILSPGPH